ncbi:uncharacterized protein METZ01_LOCUS408826 [marine metagenome]|uniref:Uncharacterized protein n=1 Tax=marine metagenome TaxID=408172 RepID=A0A382WAZ9_9ZZZZ
MPNHENFISPHKYCVDHVVGRIAFQTLCSTYQIAIVTGEKL